MRKAAMKAIRRLTVPLCLLLLPAGLQAQAEDAAWKRHMEAASTALQVNNPDDALFALGNALREAERFGPGDPRLGSTLGIMASFQRSQGNFVEAASMYLRIVSVRERRLGKDHPEVADALDTLATLYQEEHTLQQVDHTHQDEHTQQDDQRLESAETILQRALEIREKAYGMDHPSVDASVIRLAVLYGAQGKYDEAEALLRRSLETRERVLGEEGPEVAVPTKNPIGDENRRK